MLLSVGLKGHFHPLFNYAGSLVESVGNHDWVEFQNCGQVGSLPPVLNLNTHKVSLGEDAPHGICPYFFKAVSKGTLPGVAGIVAAVAVAMWGKAAHLGAHSCWRCRGNSHLCSDRVRGPKTGHIAITHQRSWA
jgi:hypothetical protein